jgi:hypothetical protein
MHFLAIKAREGTEYRGQKKKGGGERHREQGRTEEKRKREGEREKNTENRGNRWGIIKKKKQRERTNISEKKKGCPRLLLRWQLQRLHFQQPLLLLLEKTRGKS